MRSGAVGLETVWKVSTVPDLERGHSPKQGEMDVLALSKHETQAIKTPPAIFQTVSLDLVEPTTVLERLGHKGVGKRSQDRAPGECEREGQVLLGKLGEHSLPKSTAAVSSTAASDQILIKWRGSRRRRSPRPRGSEPPGYRIPKALTHPLRSVRRWEYSPASMPRG
jgi:hypothetical protein